MGAACALAERLPENEKRPVIVVPNVQHALELICAENRARLTLPVIGITGSVGKTSAKEMISAVLGKKYNVLKTEGNLNNQIGVPMTVSRLEKEHDAAVIELGISHFGDMKQIASVAMPTVAVFTVIGHAHLEFLGDLNGVMREKTSMIDFLPEDGLVIFNGDDAMLNTLSCRQRKLSFGLSEHCSVRAENVLMSENGFTQCDISYENRRIHACIPAFGAHMVYAALEGAAVGFAFGLEDEAIIEGIAEYKTVGRRAAVSDTGFVTLIDDCYNANPDSVKSAIDSLTELKGRHICVLGDMLELGENADKLHEEVGEYALKKGVDAIYAHGELSRYTVSASGGIGTYYESVDELKAALVRELKRGDEVLVKASNSSGFSEISEFIKEIGEENV